MSEKVHICLVQSPLFPSTPSICFFFFVMLAKDNIRADVLPEAVFREISKSNEINVSPHSSNGFKLGRAKNNHSKYQPFKGQHWGTISPLNILKKIKNE